MAAFSVSELAARLEASVDGRGDVTITGVAGIRYARAGDISFVSQLRYAADAQKTAASALIVGLDWNQSLAIPLIRVKNAEAAFTRVAQWYSPPPVVYPPGIHPTAVISAEATLGKDVHIGPYCVVGAKASIGARSVLVGHNVLGEGASIGESGLLYPMVTVREHVRIGARVIIHNGAVIGSDGFGYDADKQGVRTKIPQIGIVEIGDDVEIGANTTIDRARFGKTIIGHGVKIDNLVMVAHNVTIGDHAVLVGQVGIAGSASIGHHAILAGQVGVVGHCEVGPGTIVLTRAAVTKNIPAKTMVGGMPAIDHREYKEQAANVSRLPQLKKRVAELEARLKALEEKS